MCILGGYQWHLKTVGRAGDLGTGEPTINKVENLAIKRPLLQITSQSSSDDEQSITQRIIHGIPQGFVIVDQQGYHYGYHGTDYFHKQLPLDRDRLAPCCLVKRATSPASSSQTAVFASEETT